MDSSEIVVTTVRVQLAKQNKTQKQLAEEIGMDPTSFSRLMVGKRDWTVKILDKMARPLGFHSSAALFKILSTPTFVAA
ncbi:helix-turn-helix domain-containing protein [Bifidobacterium mongoliense]|uniref:helix-turn-helix domain-containing protein n=1 Tax=Bifidobacterium mongoliense TaxID=518643 RepID=UPI0026474503|nr:helix-turn-helix transcriptional regulator [Bifidobacterium mongoliense]MDN6024746.1 helix-turn-helix transcriptional regulator [Bifidobacterium mongoliense]MDN6720281.1 helix-turn-helix transcriptional regulator [Bifidobacterium mongoliense]